MSQDRMNTISRMGRRPFLRGASTAVIGALASSCARTQQQTTQGKRPGPYKKTAQRQNVIVIMTDSLRPDHVGSYGSNKWIKTPNFDCLHAEAAIFTSAYGEGLPTMPCRTAMWTGKFTFPNRGWQPLEQRDTVLAEVLWDKGYTSALITDTYHMHKPSFNMDRGFDYTEWIRGQEGDPFIVDPNVKVDLDKYHKPKPGQEKYEQLEQYLKNVAGWKTDADSFVAQVVKSGLRWLENQKKRDHLFLWLDCFDPHEPWNPMPPFNRMYDPNYKGKEIIHPLAGDVAGYLTDEELKHIKALYAGEVTQSDKWIGIFIEGLKDMGLYDDALILHVSDHGQPMGEHGIIRKAQPWPYEELGHIVFTVRRPDGVGGGKKINSFVHSCDVMPTVLDYLGIAIPEKTQGKSVMPLIEGKAEKNYSFGVSSYYGQTWSIRDTEWSYYDFSPPKPAKPVPPGPVPLTKTNPELYNYKTDAYEQKNLIAQEPGRTEDLRRKLMEFAASVTV